MGRGLLSKLGKAQAGEFVLRKHAEPYWLVRDPGPFLEKGIIKSSW